MKTGARRQIISAKFHGELHKLHCEGDLLPAMTAVGQIAKNENWGIVLDISDATYFSADLACLNTISAIRAEAPTVSLTVLHNPNIAGTKDLVSYLRSHQGQYAVILQSSDVADQGRAA